MLASSVRHSALDDPVLKPLDIMLLAMLIEGPSHGYALGKRIETPSKGEYSASSNHVYRVLKVLKTKGFVEARIEDQGKKKVLYGLTPDGTKELRRRLLLLRFDLTSSSRWVDDVLGLIQMQRMRVNDYG